MQRDQTSLKRVVFSEGHKQNPYKLLLITKISSVFRHEVPHEDI